jgi:uncharacterized protein YjiK
VTAAVARPSVWLVLATFCLPAQSGGAPSRLERCLAAAPAHRWELPPLFREISGLALTGDGRLLFHNDEQALLAALDPDRGWILGTYRLGSPPVRGDFEGVAVAGQRLFLVTSDGVLYETVVPPPSENRGEFVLRYRIHTTGLGERCEVEGLTYDPTDDTLLFACKTPRQKSLRDAFTVFRWSLADERLAPADQISVPLDELKKGRPGKEFRGSGLDRDPVSGRLLAIAGADRAIAEFDAAGAVLATRALPARHRQAEGIVVTRDGRLIISDEGGRSAGGAVTVYACR